MENYCWLCIPMLISTFTRELLLQIKGVIEIKKYLYKCYDTYYIKNKQQRSFYIRIKLFLKKYNTIMQNSIKQAGKEKSMDHHSQKNLPSINQAQKSDLKDYSKRRFHYFWMIYLNVFLASFLMYFLLRLYLQSSQEPLCMQRNVIIKPVILLQDAILALNGIIFFVIFIFACFQRFSVICYIGYLPEKKRKLIYMIKLFLTIIFIFVLTNILSKFLHEKCLFSHQISQYSLCNKILIRGKQQEQTIIQENKFINTNVTLQIQSILQHELYVPRDNRSIIYIEGTSGVGKSTALKHAVNKLLKSNRNKKQKKQLLIYYNDLQTLESTSNNIGYFLFLELKNQYGKNNQRSNIQNNHKQLKQIQNQFMYLAKRAKIIIILDGVNQIKDNLDFLENLKMLADLQTNMSLDIHILICSSQQDLQKYYDSKNQSLKWKKTETKIVRDLETQQLRGIFDRLVSQYNIEEKFKTQIRSSKNKIVDLSYGFGELLYILNYIKNQTEISSVDKILQELKIKTFKSYIKEIILPKNQDNSLENKNNQIRVSQNDRMAICFILQRQSGLQKINQDLFDVENLKKKNILFGKKKFYSKLILVSFKENFQLCKNKETEKIIEIQRSNTGSPYQQSPIEASIIKSVFQVIESIGFNILIQRRRLRVVILQIIRLESKKIGAKTVGKLIPVGGIFVGGAMSVWRALKGDFGGAAAQLTSGFLGAFGVGAPVALSIDAGLIARDIVNELKQIGYVG